VNVGVRHVQRWWALSGLVDGRGENAHSFETAQPALGQRDISDQPTRTRTSSFITSSATHHDLIGMSIDVSILVHFSWYDGLDKVMQDGKRMSGKTGLNLESAQHQAWSLEKHTSTKSQN
jgi:hypothetical protein